MEKDGQEHLMIIVLVVLFYGAYLIIYICTWTLSSVYQLWEIYLVLCVWKVEKEVEKNLLAHF